MSPAQMKMPSYTRDFGDPVLAGYLAEFFGEEGLAMPMRIPVGDLTRHAVAMSEVQTRSLIVHGIHIRMDATAGRRFALRMGEQRRANASRSPRRADGHDRDAQPCQLRLGKESS